MRGARLRSWIARGERHPAESAEWTHAARESFARNGFALVPGAVPEDYLRRVQTVLERLADDAIGRWRDRDDLRTVPPATEPFASRLHTAWVEAGRPRDVGRGCDTRMDCDDVATLTTDPWLRALAASALECPSVRALPESYFRAKLPGDVSTDIPWHQDAPCVAPVSGIDFVTLWIPLQAVTPTTSCLEVMPFGERRELPKTWSTAIDYVTMHPDAHPPAEARRTMAMARGDVLVLGPHLPHRPLPQVDAPIRWSIDLRFAPER